MSVIFFRHNQIFFAVGTAFEVPGQMAFAWAFSDHTSPALTARASFIAIAKRGDAVRRILFALEARYGKFMSVKFEFRNIN